MSTVYNKAAFETAYAKIATAPLTLTAADLDQLEVISPTIERTGREALRQAQLAIVQKHVLQTKDASPVDRSRRPVLHKHLVEFADQVGTVLAELMQQNVLPLKDKIAQLESRCLELEADRAARDEGAPHANH